MDAFASRKSPRLNKNLKIADSSKKAEKNKRKVQTSEEPGPKRRLICEEPAVVEAKHVRCVNADEIFPDLQQIMDEQWGPKDIRGFKESSVKPEWAENFYKHYEIVFGKREVTNRHVPEYFARAFALQLTGKKVDWDTFKVLAKDLAKGGAKESAITEEIATSKSTSKVPKFQQGFYPKEELEFAETLLQQCHGELISSTSKVEELKIQQTELRDNINKISGRKDAHEEDLAQIQEDINSVLDDAKQNKRDIKTVQQEVDLLMRDRTRKEEMLKRIQEPLEKAIREKELCEKRIAELEEAHKVQFECCRRLDDMHKYMMHSAAILLQPKTSLVSSPAEEKFISVHGCVFCSNGFANNEPILVAPCEHSFHIFCFSYSISAGLSCPRACKWDDNISKTLGVYTGELQSAKKTTEQKLHHRSVLEVPKKIEVQDVAEGKKAVIEGKSKITIPAVIQVEEAGTSGLHGDIPDYDEELERLREQAKATSSKVKAAAENVTPKKNSTPKKPQKKTIKAVETGPNEEESSEHQDVEQDTFKFVSNIASDIAKDAEFHANEKSGEVEDEDSGPNKNLSEETKKAGKEMDTDFEKTVSAEQKNDLYSSEYRPYDALLNRMMKLKKARIFPGSLPEMECYLFEQDVLDMDVGKFSNRHVDMYARYLQLCVPDDKKADVWFFPPDSFMEFAAWAKASEKDKSMAASERGRDIVKVALTGINWLKCRWIMIPMLCRVTEHHTLAIFNMALTKSKNTINIQIFNSAEDIDVDMLALKRLHILTMARGCVECPTFLKHGQNPSPVVKIHKCPQQKDGDSCGLYVAAYMQKFVDTIVCGKTTNITRSWFLPKYAEDRRDVLTRALLQELDHIHIAPETIRPPGVPKRLIVFDINNVLAKQIHRTLVSDDQLVGNYDIIGKKVLFLRPHLDEFLEFVFEHFEVGIWSSIAPWNLSRVVDKILTMTQIRDLKFTFDGSHCLELPFRIAASEDKPLYLKPIEFIYEKYPDRNDSNTLIVDDSEYKMLFNPNENCICPPSWQESDVEDTGLLTLLKPWLEGLLIAPDLQQYVKQNPLRNPSDVLTTAVWRQMLSEGYKDRDGMSRLWTSCKKVTY